MPENTGKTASEWVFIARSVAKLPDGQSQALRCMAQAGMSAQDVTDWLEVAQAWAQDFNDSEMAQQYMSIAESRAGYPYAWEDWIAIARAWDQVFDDHDMAQQWMAKAEAFAEEYFNIHDWIQMAKTWKNRFRDRTSGIQCLEETEVHAKDSGDWIQIAEAWKSGFRNRNNGIRCLEEAESHAEDSEGWVQIAKIWEEDFQNSDRGIRCLKKAEDLAKNARDWGRIGWIWERPFGDSDNSKRCLRVAYGDVRPIDPFAGPIDDFEAALLDHKALQKGGVASLGFIREPYRTFVGTWGDECVSKRRPGCGARYYIFSLAQAVFVVIDLTSKYADTYLYLMSGDSADGVLLDQNDDADNDKLSNTNSRIIRFLDAGTYTVEATTYSEMKGGAFNLKIYIPK